MLSEIDFVFWNNSRCELGDKVRDQNLRHLSLWGCISKYHLQTWYVLRKTIVFLVVPQCIRMVSYTLVVHKQPFTVCKYTEQHVTTVYMFPAGNGIQCITAVLTYTVMNLLIKAEVCTVWIAVFPRGG